VDVVIRSPERKDAAGLARAARDLAQQYGELEPDRFRVPDEAAQLAWYGEALQRPRDERSIWLVAELDGEAVGEAQAQLHEPVGNADVQLQLDVGRRRVYLNYLAVQAAHRSRGIGSNLLEAVEAWAREQGAELIETDTNLRSNVGAVEFYERNGYDKQSVVLRKLL
jgi:GNAT superfamily N-acetyltransferase